MLLAREDIAWSVNRNNNVFVLFLKLWEKSFLD